MEDDVLVEGAWSEWWRCVEKASAVQSVDVSQVRFHAEDQDVLEIRVFEEVRLYAAPVVTVAAPAPTTQTFGLPLEQLQKANPARPTFPTC